MRGQRNIFQVGDKYGLLTIIKVWSEMKPVSKHKSKETVCECLCECGNTITVRTRYIKNGHKSSCGCLHKRTGNKHPAWKGYGEISSSIWANIRSSAKKRARELEFNLTIEEIWELFLKQNRKCSLTGIELSFGKKNRRYENTTTASLDRIDSSKNYTIDNVQWVHKTINSMKQSLSQSDFIDWCKKVSNHN